jgi:hypothetical protein
VVRCFLKPSSKGQIASSGGSIFLNQKGSTIASSGGSIFLEPPSKGQYDSLERGFDIFEAFIKRAVRWPRAVVRFF